MHISYPKLTRILHRVLMESGWRYYPGVYAASLLYGIYLGILYVEVVVGWLASGRRCEPITHMLPKTAPNTRVIVSAATRLTGVKVKHYSRYRGKDGSLHIYGYGDNGRILVVLREVVTVHEETGEWERYYSLVYADVCREVDGDGADSG